MDNGMFCHVCQQQILAPVYSSSGSFSLTSLCQIAPSSVSVYFCPRCAHVQTTEIGDLEAYYAHDYKITIQTPEEDQIYQITNGQTLFRFDHQVKILQHKLNLPQGARVLDYGCAKSATMRKLTAVRPDLEIHLFDVSDMYLPFWAEFAKPQNWATYTVPPDWHQRFDLVTSFFALEHVADPVKFMQQIYALLKPGGSVYMIVPNFLVNTADFVVADHVQHFTPVSFETLLALSGFELVALDSESHYGAWIVHARAASTQTPAPQAEAVAELKQRVETISAYWTGLSQSVQAFEQAHVQQVTAVYGAGFYGAFISACLQNPEALACYIDRNPHLQGNQHLGKPVVAPENLPDQVQAIYVGLNPAIARDAIAQLSSWRERSLDYYWL